MQIKLFVVGALCLSVLAWRCSAPPLESTGGKKGPKLVRLIRKGDVDKALGFIKGCEKEDVSNDVLLGPEIGNISPLAQAAARGLVELFKPLVEKGADVNKESELGFYVTPLYMAVIRAPMSRKVAAVQALLHLGADPNLSVSLHTTPFLEALEFGKELVSVFFDKEVQIKPNLVQGSGFFRPSALQKLLRQESPSIEILKFLLEKGADPGETEEVQIDFSVREIRREALRKQFKKSPSLGSFGIYLEKCHDWDKGEQMSLGEWVAKYRNNKVKYSFPSDVEYLNEEKNYPSYQTHEILTLLAAASPKNGIGFLVAKVAVAVAEREKFKKSFASSSSIYGYQHIDFAKLAKKLTTKLSKGAISAEKCWEQARLQKQRIIKPDVLIKFVS